MASLTRRAFLASPPLLAAAQQTATQPPVNLLLITADNLGYGDLGCYGNTEIHTPHLDKLSAEGTRFTNFYTASPTCTASRAGLLTGRHPVRFGLNYQLKPEENKRGIGLPHSERLLPAYVKPARYATACFGKWNLGWAPGSRPTERGFDEFFGHRSGNIDYYSHVYNGEADMYRGIEPAKVEGYSTDLFADAAISFLERQRSRPFLLYLPFNSPHFPNKANLSANESPEWQAPEKYFAHYGYSVKEPDERKRYRAVVTALDDAIGRVLQAVERNGLASRTVVFFYSDNGAFMLPGRGLEVQTNKPLRDGGVTCWEGGIRVAGMARWPGRIPAGSTCTQILSAFDVLPLAAGLARQQLRGPRLDGVDPLPALTRNAKPAREALYFEYGAQQAMRSGRWKLLREKPVAPWQLFDVDSDIGETSNVATQHPGEVKRLSAMWDHWRRDATPHL
jgi:arylsulfatase A-like enzyme